MRPDDVPSNPLAGTLRTDRPTLRRHLLVGLLCGTLVGGTTALVTVDGGNPLLRPALAGLVGGVIVGCGGAALGIGHLRMAHRVDGAARPDAATPGRVVVTGRARPVAEPTQTPLSGQVALCRVTDVAERTERGLWDPRHREAGGVQFRVADEGGAVVVDPTSATLDLGGRSDREWRLTVGGDESPPEPVAAWLRAGQRATGYRERRYRERWVGPGDEVTVVGTARQRDNRLVLDESARAVITHGAAAVNAATDRRDGRWLVAVGGATALGAYLPLAWLAFG